MKLLKNYSDSFLLFLLFVQAFNPVSAQGNMLWTDIHLIDTLTYTAFHTDNITDKRYPPSNLFDGNVATCWVGNPVREGDTSSIFVRLAGHDNIVVNIFPGYGKNSEVFYKNSRPRTIQFSVHVGVNPSGGYVSEIGINYKTKKYSEEILVQFPDSFGIQSVPLNFNKEKLDAFIAEVHSGFDSEFGSDKGSSCLILKMQLLDVWPGTKYNHVCISELFFNDRFVSTRLNILEDIRKIYTNAEENTLLIDTDNKQGVNVYSDPESVLQIVEISKNNRWAILISMPAIVGGRAETIFHLFDLASRKPVNVELEKSTGNYVAGNEMFFENDEKNRVILTYLASDHEYYSVELW